MKLFRRLKEDNRGSALVFVMVTILFLAIFVSLILSLATTEYRVRTNDYGARQAFYENEEYTGRIYTEVGMTAVGILGEAYADTMAKISGSTISTEKQLNDDLKLKYYKRMLRFFKLVDSSVTDAELLVPISIAKPADPVDAATKHGMNNTLLQKMADGKDTTPLTKVSIEGDIKAELVNATGEYEPLITLEKVHISYINSENTYVSDITFDLVVGYPDWDFTFSDPKQKENDLDTFIDYIFISNGKLTFNGGNTASVNGCISVGDNKAIADAKSENVGLHVDNGTRINCSSSPSNKYDNYSIVVTDNIMINSSATAASSFNVNGGAIWCNSILLKRATSDTSTIGSSFNSTNSNLFIQDDLQLDGEYSSASINGGSYYGYNYNNTNTANTQNFSSAIILNGNNSKLNISGMSNLSINGLAYLDFTNNGQVYRTGESLSVIGNQDIYLVPSECIPNPYSNPHRFTNNYSTEIAISHDIRTNVTDPSKFFGTQWLDATQPVVTQDYTLNNKVYRFYYLNFASASAQAEYARFVLSDQTVAATAANNSLKAVRDRVKENLAKFNNNAEEFIRVSLAGANVYSAGAMVTSATGGMEYGSEVTSISSATMALEYTTFANRYTLLKSSLIAVPDSEMVNNFMNVVCKDMEVKHANNPVKYPNAYRTEFDNGSLVRSAVYNIVDWNMLRTYAASSGGVYKNYQGDMNIVYSAYPYTVVESKGIVVVDGDVNVSSNFTGVIISTGNINVTAGASFVSDGNGVYDALVAAQKDDTATGGKAYSNVFYAFPVINADKPAVDEIGQLIYGDVLTIDNWKRY